LLKLKGVQNGAIFGSPCIKCTRMRYFNEKNSKIFFSEGPFENVSLGPAVAVHRPASSRCDSK